MAHIQVCLPFLCQKKALGRDRGEQSTGIEKVDWAQEGLEKPVPKNHVLGQENNNSHHLNDPRLQRSLSGWDTENLYSRQRLFMLNLESYLCGLLWGPSWAERASPSALKSTRFTRLLSATLPMAG